MNKLQRIQQKIYPNLDALVTQRGLWKTERQKVVFTNGCFDILHMGHVTYLAHAADMGDKLIVALNTDRSVRAQNKSPERPINPEEARLLVLASLEFIDAVVVFDKDTPLDEIKSLQPDILVKGADYDPNELDENHKRFIVGSKEVRNSGGEVRVVDLVDGFSTTKILSKKSQSS